MEGIKQWIICIIFSSVVAAVVNILTPDSSVSRIMKVVVATFLLSSFISPFIGEESLGIDEEFNDFSYYYSSLALDVSDAMKNEAEKAAEIKILQFLKDKNIEFEEITIVAETDNQNVICIEEITITAKDEYKSYEKEISDEIRKMFSVETSFVWLKN